MTPFLDVFREEAHELLGELEAALLELEAGSCPEAAARVFRTLHTLKGSGAMTGFKTVAVLVHEIESAFELVRCGYLPVGRELISLTLAVRDRIKTLIEGENSHDLGDAERALIDAVRTFVAQVDGVDQRSGDDPAAVEDLPTYQILFRPPADIFRKGINPLGLLQELERLGRCSWQMQIDAIPPLDEFDAESCYFRWEITLATKEDENVIRDVFIFVEEESELHIEKIAGGSETAVPIEPTEIAPVAAATEVSAVESPLNPGTRSETGAAIRVRAEKLDALVDLVGEMVTLQARLSALSSRREDPELTSLAEDVERLAWEMRDQVLKTRMLSVGLTFGRFRRLARDLGEQLGKEVELTTEGGDTELDKTVIENLQEPLVHLIRNCVDHGIEGAERRRVAGKPIRGRIHLTASHCGSQVEIRISDDGAGLDRAAIGKRAVELGLVADCETLSDKELFGLIFHSGFSTAQKLTSISGRGIGMDVVRQAIKTLRGSIEVESRPGAGTTFIIHLPLTLAIIDGLLVQVGDENFVLPLAIVEECIELTRRSANGRRLLDVRGEGVPYIDLRKRFAINADRPEIEQVVIVEWEGRRVGLSVDQVIGSHQTVIKSLGALYRDLPGYSGATIMGDGRVAIILDIPALVQEAEIDERRLVA